MCLYWTSLLILAASDTRGLDGGIRPHDRYTFACNICRSVEYYARTIPGPFVFRIGIPLCVALDYFGESSEERPGS